LACNTQIDYSQITGATILPFLIEIDINKSILNPAPGINQRFCYNIIGVGTDSSQFTDLSHIVFGICDEIPENQIVNITVVIDGVSQPVEYGEDGNVELKTPDKPDSQTGCPGLKFNFGLNKAGGIMELCFELTSPYPVGDNEVCLFGGGTTAKGLTICGPVCSTPLPGVCKAYGYQQLSICVPVHVTPFANPLSTSTFCCGNPIITPGISSCDGIINGSCHFTLTQALCISVPVHFGATETVGSPSVECGNASGEDICTNCSE